MKFDKAEVIDRISNNLRNIREVYGCSQRAMARKCHVNDNMYMLWENGDVVETPFDGLMAFSDATELWGLNESTLRKAIAYGKLVNGVDVCKFGKQWVVSIDAMKREYGNGRGTV